MELATRDASLTVEEFIEECKFEHNLEYFTTFWQAVIGDKTEIIMDDKMVRFLGFSGTINNARTNMKQTIQKESERGRIAFKKQTYGELLGLTSNCHFESKVQRNLQIYVLPIRGFNHICMMVDTEQGQKVISIFFTSFYYFLYLMTN